jgi:hypothetical protein
VKVRSLESGENGVSPSRARDRSGLRRNKDLEFDVSCSDPSHSLGMTRECSAPVLRLPTAVSRLPTPD